MSTLVVGSAAHDQAVEWFYDAARASADAVTAAFAQLQGCGAMAGTDSGGSSWGQQYDDAAGALRGAGTTLADGCANVANLLNANLLNHAGADHAAAAAVPGGPCRSLDAATGDPDPRHLALGAVVPAPPTALGGRGGAPHGWSLIAAHLQGFLWPDADTGRLRQAADAWRAAASGLTVAGDDVEGGRRSLRAIRSPEMSVADRACAELAGHCSDVADSMRGLATACDDYAAEVDAHHAAIVDLLEQLVAWSATDQVVGGVISVVTAGAAEAPTQMVEAGVVARYAAKVVDLLRDLVAIAKGWAARVLVITGDALRTTARLARFVKAERVSAKLEVAGVRVLLRGHKLEGIVEVPRVESGGKLQNLVNDFYKGSSNPARTGDGTTADAIRKERITGEKIFKANHVEKGQQIMNGLRNWMTRNPYAPEHDLSIARRLLDELSAALNGR